MTLDEVGAVAFGVPETEGEGVDVFREEIKA